ncbi:unnamed protein product, partial [Phaeothamnion confervicola]
IFRGSDVATELTSLASAVTGAASRALAEAAAAGDRLAAGAALDDGAAIDKPLGRGGYTPLMRAASFGHRKVAKLLISEGADLFVRDRHGRTALDWARACGRDGATRLLERTMENDVRAHRTEFLLRRRRDSEAAVASVVDRLRRDLRAALEAQDLAAVLAVIDDAAAAGQLPPPKRRRRAATATTAPAATATAAAVGDSCSVAPCSGGGILTSDNAAGAPGNLFINASPAVPAAPAPAAAAAATVAAASTDPPAACPFVDVETDSGVTALILAVFRDDGDAAARLLAAGADAAVVTRRGHTALTWAAVCGHAVAAQALVGTPLGEAADPGQAVGRERRTALHYAAASGSAGVALALLD